MRTPLLHLMVGEIEGGLGVSVVGELGEEVAVGGLGVAVAACVELGLAEGVLRRRGIGVEGDSLTEFRDGGVELPFSYISGAETKMGARIVWILGDQFFIEGDGLIELPEGKIGAAEFLLISDVGRIGFIGFLKGGDSFGIAVFLEIQRGEHGLTGGEVGLTDG